MNVFSDIDRVEKFYVGLPKILKELRTVNADCKLILSHIDNILDIIEQVINQNE